MNNTQNNQNLKLSDQALGAIMMALQESLLNQLDIVPILKGFDLSSGFLRLCRGALKRDGLDLEARVYSRRSREARRHICPPLL